jgi:hypothetical protein
VSSKTEKIEKPVCAAPSGVWLVVAVFDLVGLPVVMMQPGALSWLGTGRLYWVSVCWGASVVIVVPHVTRLRFCPLALMWVALSCLGGAALYFGG